MSPFPELSLQTRLERLEPPTGKVSIVLDTDTYNEIDDQFAVVWLGGQPLYWHSAQEFNLQQDIPAAQVIFDCGVPLVQIPCKNVSEHVRTTIPEMERYIKGRGGDWRLPLPDIRRVPSRSLRLVQGHLGHHDDLVADQSPVGAFSSLSQPHPDPRGHVELQPLASFHPGRRRCPPGCDLRRSVPQTRRQGAT